MTEHDSTEHSLLQHLDIQHSWFYKAKHLGSCTMSWKGEGNYSAYSEKLENEWQDITVCSLYLSTYKNKLCHYACLIHYGKQLQGWKYKQRSTSKLSHLYSANFTNNIQQLQKAEKFKIRMSGWIINLYALFQANREWMYDHSLFSLEV